MYLRLSKTVGENQEFRLIGVQTLLLRISKKIKTDRGIQKKLHSLLEQDEMPFEDLIMKYLIIMTKRSNLSYY